MVRLLIFIRMLGRLGDRAKFHVSNGLYLEPVMRSIDLPYTVIEQRDQLGEIRRADAHSRTSPKGKVLIRGWADLTPPFWIKIFRIRVKACEVMQD